MQFSITKFSPMTIDRKFVIAGAIFGAVGVIFGALGAHAMKKILDPSSLESFNTGVRYQMYHALLLVVLSVISVHITPKMSAMIFWLIVSGILCFSFSIYFLNLGPVYNMNMKFLGPITPIGGLLLITAWALIAIEFIRNRS